MSQKMMSKKKKTQKHHKKLTLNKENYNKKVIKNVIRDIKYRKVPTNNIKCMNEKYEHKNDNTLSLKVEDFMNEEYPNPDRK